MATATKKKNKSKEKPAGDNQNLTPIEVAKRLGVAPNTVRAWIAANLIEWFPLPSTPGAQRKRQRIPLHAVEKIEKSKGHPNGQAETGVGG